MGDGGDTELAHVNLAEIALLKASGGLGTINGRTGLREFKGGGSSKPAETTSYSTNLPEYAQPFYEELLKQTGKQTYTTDPSGNVTGVKAFNPYGGDRVAGFTDQQAALRGETAGLASPAGFQQAQTGLAQGTNLGFATGQAGINAAQNYAPGSLAQLGVATPNTFGNAQAQQYMSPYQQNVTDVQLAEARRQADITKNTGALGSIGRGTFGGGRQALVSSELDRNLATQLGRIQAEGSQAAYGDAQKQFERDRAAGMSAEEANLKASMDLRARQQQGEQYETTMDKELGLAGLQIGMEGSKEMGALSRAEQTSNLERLKAQAASAGEVQALQQEIDNLAYQEFMEKENYERGLLQYQSDILRGNAGALGSTTTQYAAPPSLASQITGLGLAGIGLAKSI